VRLDWIDNARHFAIEGNDVARVRGAAGYGIRLGDRMVAFTAEQVDTVGLKVDDGHLQITLRAESGEVLGSRRIPSTAVLTRDLSALRDAGIVLQANERAALADLLKLSMTGAMSREEMVLLLDEISHMAPRAPERTGLDVGNLHPELTTRIREVLMAMPDEIQRFVLLANHNHIPEEDWHALHFLSKVDARVDKAMTRFLAGGNVPEYQLIAELREIALRNPLDRPQGIASLDPASFRRLVAMLAEVRITGNGRIFDFAPAVARMALERYPISIPDFTAAESFEALESQLLTRLGAEGKTGRLDPLTRVLTGLLDAGKYRETAAFLSGGQRFTTEAREGLHHFMKNLPEQAPATRITSLDARALDRARHFLTTSFPDLERVLETALPGDGSRRLPLEEGSVARFAHMSRGERLAIFVLDHLDPVRHRGLFDYFNGRTRLSRMTPDLIRALNGFLAQKGHAGQQQGTIQPSTARFAELAGLLQSRGDLGVPPGYFPESRALRDMLSIQTLPDGDRPPVQQGAVAGDRPRTNAELRALAEQIEARLASVEPGARDRLLSRLLRDNLGSFTRIAALDQAWRGLAALEGALAGNGGQTPRAALVALREVLVGKENPDLKWFLMDREASPSERRDPNPDPRVRALREDRGPARYLFLDRMLARAGDPLIERTRNLALARRLDHLLDRLDGTGTDPSAKRNRVLTRLQGMLLELTEVLGRDPKRDWGLLADSPLTKRKGLQFAAFREALLAGGDPDPSPLFEGPFLRSELGSATEQTHAREMRRLEPLFREAMMRLEQGEEELLRAVLARARGSADLSPADVTGRVRGLIESLHDFNQFQNLNDQPLYLALPLRYGRHESQMELAAFRLPGKQKERGRFLVVIHLDFPDWGHLRVDALKQSESLTATFWTETRAMQNLLMDDLHLLEDRLEETGIASVSLNVRLAPRRATRQVSELCSTSPDGALDFEV